MGKVWVTSDYHFNHDRDFIYKSRGFGNVQDMNRIIIKNHNNVVAPDDDVYILGDVMLGDNEEGIKLVKQLKGNLHIIRGNHDTDARVELYKDCWNVVEVCDAKFLKFEKIMFYMTHFPSICANFGEETKPSRCIVNLCGHSHTKEIFEDWNKYNSPIIHCELDANYMEPVDLKYVGKFLKDFW